MVRWSFFVTFVTILTQAILHTFMIRREIAISIIDGKIQYLSDIYPVIETNTVLKKSITGIGATYSEIKAPRHSIIIEPTKPVIYGKTASSQHKGDNLLGVYEGVLQDIIIDYIENSIHQNKWIKILTTPESFRKVLDAFNNLGIDIQHDGYFLLFDEIHRTITDSNYRENITLPMDFFFGCKNKAIVSATPPKTVIDKRLKDFQIVTVVPDFDYKKDVTLYATNNVLQRTRELLEELKADNRPIFIFVNSVSIINSMIKQLDVRDESAVFCSSQSFVNVKCNEFQSVYEHWNKEKMAQYNWLTSRFFSALDIEIAEAPNVVMLTNCFRTDYTMIDPYMDAVQIVGRFRNGVNKISHISNFDKRIPIKSRDDLKESVKSMMEVYRYLGIMAKSAPTATQREAFLDARSVVPFSRFLKENGEADPYKIDNYFNEEAVKSLYNNSQRLVDAYNESGFFNLIYKCSNYIYGDFERLKIDRNTTSIKEKRKEIVAQLERLGNCYTMSDFQLKRDLEFADSLIVEAYEILGREEIERLNYSHSKIKAAIILKRHQEKAHSTDAINLINISFHAQQWYSSNYIKSKLIKIFSEFGIPIKGVTAKTIKEYFEATEKRTNTKRGYFLNKPLFVQR